MNKAQKIPILFLFLLTNFLSASFSTESELTDNTVSLNGTVYEIPDRMDGCNIIVHQNGVPTIFTKSDSEGNFSLKLALGSDYIVEFSYPGYTAKKISLDAKSNAPAEGNFAFDDLVIDLFKEISAEDAASLPSPVAKINFDNTTNSFRYDMKYNENIQKKVQELWNKVYSARIERDEHFTDNMTVADSNFVKQEYQKAREQYVDALKFRPMAVDPKEKIKFIDGLGKEEEVTDEPANTIPAFEVVDNYNEEQFKTSNKVITVRKVVNSGQKVTYKKVECNYGGTYFFKNNTPISSILWEIETKRN